MLEMILHGLRPEMAEDEEQAAEEELEMRTKTLMRWANYYLVKQHHEPLHHLYRGLDNGVKLIQLVSSLYDQPVPKHYTHPSKQFQIRDNIDTALSLAQEQGLPLRYIAVDHFIKQDQSNMDAFLWLLMIHSTQAQTHLGLVSVAFEDYLLAWVQSHIKHYPGLDDELGVTNFDTHWKSGLAFAALLHSLSPDAIMYNPNQEPLLLLRLVFAAASEKHAVPMLLDAQDIITDPDHDCIVCYLCELHKGFDGQVAPMFTAGDEPIEASDSFQEIPAVAEQEPHMSQPAPVLHEEVQSMEDESFYSDQSTIDVEDLIDELKASAAVTFQPHPPELDATPEATTNTASKIDHMIPASADYGAPLVPTEPKRSFWVPIASFLIGAGVLLLVNQIVRRPHQSNGPK